MSHVRVQPVVRGRNRPTTILESGWNPSLAAGERAAVEEDDGWEVGLSGRPVKVQDAGLFGVVGRCVIGGGKVADGAVGRVGHCVSGPLYPWGERVRGGKADEASNSWVRCPPIIAVRAPTNKRS